MSAGALDSAPPRPAYVEPELVTYPADSWQAQLAADIEAARRGKNRVCVTVIVDDGPVRWFVGQQRQRGAVLPKR